MNKLILAGAAALAFAVPAAAQTTVAVDANGNAYVMTDAQQTMYDGWPAERQTMYTAWPSTYQTYYWTLTPTQADGWWVLTDEQRSRVYGMTPEQRVQAWTAIERQMSGMPPSDTAPSANASTTATAATTASASASTMSPRFVAGEVVQTTSASANASANLTDASALPVCAKNQQDGCINSWEKNKTGTRPLNYWPGRPASEMPGKKPMK